jgi:hypothetical protein
MWPVGGGNFSCADPVARSIDHDDKIAIKTGATIIALGFLINFIPYS